MPRLHFPQQPGGEGLAPAPGGRLPPGQQPPGGPFGGPAGHPGEPQQPGPLPPAGQQPGAPWPPGAGPQTGGPGQPGGSEQPGGPGQPSQWPPGQQWQPGQPGGPTPGNRRAPRRSGAPQREVQQRAIAGLIFGMLALLALLGVSGNVHRGIYLVAFSLVVGVAAGVLEITAMRKARRGGTRRPRGAVAGTIFGVIATALSLLFVVTLALFSAQLSTYSRCTAAAQTLTAQQACSNQFYKSVDRSVGAGAG